MQVPADANLTSIPIMAVIHAEKLRGDLTMEGSNATMEVV